MNKYYQRFISIREPARSPVFDWVKVNVLDQIENPTILEIGAIRPLEYDPDLSYFSDGYSSFHWAVYLRKRGCGKLTIVDIEYEAIKKAVQVLEDFQDINIEFVCDDGLKYANQNYSLIYLDGPDDIKWNYDTFRQVNRKTSHVLCDDANDSPGNPGKCFILKAEFPDFKLFNLENTTHQMIYYPKL